MDGRGLGLGIGLLAEGEREVRSHRRRLVVVHRLLALSSAEARWAYYSAISFFLVISFGEELRGKRLLAVTGWVRPGRDELIK